MASEGTAFGPRQADNFLDRYWRGELPLLVASGAAVVLPAILILLPELARNLHGNLDLDPVVVLGIASLPLALLALLLIVQVVGLWRAAGRHRRTGQPGTALSSFAGKALAGLCVIGVGYLVAARNAPQIVEFYRLALLGDWRFPDGKFELLAGGEELSFSGGIKRGTADEFARMLAQLPEVRVLHLDSRGGRPSDAAKLARLVQWRGLETYVSNECLSVCTLVFAAGGRRWLSDAARLGFHGTDMPATTGSRGGAGDAEWAAIYRRQGVEPVFIDKALAVAADDMWFPTVDELMKGKVVTDIDRGENFQTSGYEAVPNLAEVEASVRANDEVIDELHAFSPEVGRKVTVLMREAMVEGSDDKLKSIDLLVDEVIRRLVYLADDEVLVQFATLTADRFEAVQKLGAAACVEHARGVSVGTLSDELEDRMDDFYVKVLRTTKDRPVPDPALVDTAWAAVTDSMSDDLLEIYLKDSAKLEPKEYEAHCRSSIAIYRGIAGLPQEQAAVLLRRIYWPRE